MYEELDRINSNWHTKVIMLIKILIFIIRIIKTHEHLEKS